MRRQSEIVRIGVSACLLGETVRYDGRHKYDPCIATLAGLFTLVPVCPEVEIGLGVPRETLHLIRRDGELRIVGTETGKDHTSKMRDYARRRARELCQLGLCGYIFKEGSPSCGLGGITVEDGSLATRGIFAADVLVGELASLPAEQEAALRDPISRNRFVERVLAYHESQRDRPGA